SDLAGVNIDAYAVQRQATRVEGFESNLRLRLGNSRLGLGYARANGRYDADVDGRLDSDLAGVNIDAYAVQRQATRVEGFESNLRLRLG
ncbi:hypothetical protein CP993_25575, partial [Escherichia coli]